MHLLVPSYGHDVAGGGSPARLTHTSGFAITCQHTRVLWMVSTVTTLPAASRPTQIRSRSEQRRRAAGIAARDRRVAPPGRAGALHARRPEWLAALSRLLPRRRWAAIFSVTPVTILAGTVGWPRGNGTTPHAAGLDVRQPLGRSKAWSFGWLPTIPLKDTGGCRASWSGHKHP
jgi:hypothetical protein